MTSLADGIPSAMIQGSSVGTALQDLLLRDDIQPGSLPSYETCKQIYLFHPLGAKMVEKPVKIAMSQKRKISVPDAPSDSAVKAFETEWKKMNSDRAIFMTRVLSKVYGIASLAVLIDGEENSKALNPEKIWKSKISFNIYDPLNTAGSLVLNQNPLAIDFQHAQEIRVQNDTFHRSKARVVMNEFPIYISYTSSAFGFVGRSVYQRSLFPLKSFIQTMITNDMISVKAGTIVAKIKQYGAAVTNAMLAMVGIKRNVVKEARVGNVISIGTDGEEIESIDLKNMSEPFMTARKNIVEDIASGAPMPAKMLTDESFAQGFADGTEDAMEQARYIDSEREQMEPLYEFMDDICMRRAWNPDWYANVQREYPVAFGKVDYEAAFFMFKDSFKAEWPSLLKEPESEQIQVADVKFKALIAVLQVLMPKLNGENFTKTVQWIADNMNEMPLLFGSPLTLNWESMEADFETESENTDLEEPQTPKPFSAADAIQDFEAAHDKLVSIIEARKKRIAEFRGRSDKKAA